MGECRQQKHTQHAPSMKTECNYLNGWIKKTVTYAKISPKSGEPQRYSWGTQKKNNNNNNNRFSNIQTVSRRPGWELKNVKGLTEHVLSLNRTTKRLILISPSRQANSSSGGLQRICSWHPSIPHSQKRGSSQGNHDIERRRRRQAKLKLNWYGQPSLAYGPYFTGVVKDWDNNSLGRGKQVLISILYFTHYSNELWRMAELEVLDIINLQLLRETS